MKTKNLRIILCGLTLAACGSPTQTAPDQPMDVAANEVPSETALSEAITGVEITLQDELDGILNSYCLDIAGGNQDVDPNNGLQAHTCYSYRGDLGTDQIFAPGQFAENVLYMPEYQVCATLTGLESGAEVGLAECDGSDMQAIAFSGTGAITPIAAPGMCFTAAEESRFGRGSQHQIKDLSLEPCSDDLAPYQQWRTRSEDD